MDSLEFCASFEEDWETYEELYDTFEWHLPNRLNIGTRICDRWSESADRIAVRSIGTDEVATKEYSYRRLIDESNRFANFLDEAGVGRGDRVAIHTTKRPEAVVAHIAAWQLGAVSVILNPLTGHEELVSKVRQTDAEVCVLDTDVFPSEIEPGMETLPSVVLFDTAPSIEGGKSYAEIINGRSNNVNAAETAPDDDAFIVYTSGTTGEPKGVVHTHATLVGHLPTFYLTFAALDLESCQTFWSVSSWASITLMSNVITPIFEGRTVLAHTRTSQFDPERALQIVANQGVTHLSASPTALRMIRQIPDARSRYDFGDLHVITTGGEEVSDAIVEWWASVDVTVHEVYGQTEANNVVGDCTPLLTVSSGAIGRPMPGHDVRILDQETQKSEVTPGEVGEIAIRSDDPVCFDRYWNDPERTAETVREGWLLTGDLGYCNSDGELFFKSRKDDLILSGGYRIGPIEVEESLMTHPAVGDVGVIGVEDELRGEIPKAFVELRPEYEPSEQLIAELKEHVKEHGARYKYPREVEFIDTLPKTNTGTTARGKLRESGTE